MALTSQIHENAALSGFATGYKNGKYVADFMCPPVLADKYNDLFYKGRLIDEITPLDDLMSDEGDAAEVNIQVGSDTFVMFDRELKAYVPWKHIERSDDALRPRERALRNLMRRIGLNAEIRVADFLDTNTNYASANRITAGAVWSNEASSDPRKDLHNALESITAGGEEDSEIRVCMTYTLWHTFQRHPKVTSLMSTNESGFVTPAGFEAYFSDQAGSVKLVIARAQKNTASRTVTESVTKASVWDDDKVRIVCVPKGEPDTESAMFSCRFRLPQGGGEMDATVYEWDEPKRGPGKGSVGMKVARAESNPKALQDDMGAIILSAA